MLRRALLIAVALAALVVTAYLSFQGRDAARGATPPDAEPAAAATAEPELATAPPIPDAPMQAAAAAEAEREAVETDAASSAAEPARLAALRGRLVREDGSPVAGAALEVHGWGANQERRMRFGEPDDWQDPTGESDADGRFTLRFDPPRAYQFVLDAKAPGLAEASWRWGEIPPGEVKDVGEATLYRVGAIDVRIVDTDGNTLSDGWSVMAEEERSRESDREPVILHAFRPGADGVFHVEDVPPGQVEVEARSRLASGVSGVVAVRSGETVETELRYEGADTTHRITVNTSSRPFHVVDAEAGSIHLHGPDGTVRTAEHVRGSSQSNSFDDLPDGEYRVTIDDPRFLLWEKSGVRPGASVSARLKGSSALAIEVLDDATGAPVADWSARLRFEHVNFSPREFELVEPGAQPPAGGLLDGIVPGDFTLLVRADAYGEGSATIDALAPSETRRVVVRLSAPGVIAGVLRYGDGEAIPFQDVLAMPHLDDTPKEGERAGRDPMGDWQRKQQARTATTDEHGAFALEDLGAGVYDLLAEAMEPMKAELPGVVVKAGETTRVVLEAPPRCFLAGRCLGPAGASFDGLRIEIGQKFDPQSGPHFDVPSARAEIADDGDYRVGPVPPGDYAVHLKLPDIVRAMGPMTSRSSGPSLDLDDATLAPGETRGHDLDLRKLFPGRVHVVATRGAEPAAAWKVSLSRVREVSSEQTGPVVFAEGSAAGTLDANGEGTFGPVFAGDYVVLLEGDGKSVLAPGVVAVAPGAEAGITIDARTFAGTIAVVDADSGEPVPDHPVSIRPVPPVEGLMVGGAITAKTDAEGRAAVELAPGAYTVIDGSNPFAAMFGAGRGAQLDWSPAGPAQSVILLPSAEKSGVPNPFAEAAKKGQEGGE